MFSALILLCVYRMKSRTQQISERSWGFSATERPCAPRGLRPAVLVLACALAAGTARAQGNPPAPAKPLAITFETAAVSIANVTAGGEVVVFGLAKEYEAFYLTRRMWKETLIDTDRDGIVLLAVAAGVPGQGVWVAVDLASGQSAAAGTGTGGRGPIPEHNLRARREGTDIRALRDSRKQGYAILVKTLAAAPTAAVGVWFLGAGDGNARDADGVEDGSIELDIGNAEALGAGTPAAVPDGTGAGDRVYIVDPDTLEHYSAALASLGAAND